MSHESARPGYEGLPYDANGNRGFYGLPFLFAVPYFSANMTGNSVVLAIAAGKASFTGVSAPAMAILGFIIGSFTGAMILDKKTPAVNEKKGIRQALYVESAVLLLSQVLLLINMIPNNLAFVILPSIAMGIQAVAINHLGVKGISTITLTNTLTTAFNNLVYREEAARRAQPANSYSPALQIVAWIIFVSAAILAALLYELHFIHAMIVPLLILLICIGFGHFLNRP